MKTKYIKVSVADRLPEVGKNVYLFIEETSVGLGFLMNTGNFFICMDVSPKVQPTHYLEEVPDREEEMSKTINIYKECFEKFIPTEYWDEATEYLSTAGNGLAKDLLRREK